MRLRQARKILRKASCRREDTWARAKRKIFGPRPTSISGLTVAMMDIDRAATHSAKNLDALRETLANLPPLKWGYFNEDPVTAP